MSKKYKIIKTIIDDAPFGDINWCTISFLTSYKVDKTKNFDVRGFKIHTGQNTFELAREDGQRIKKIKKEYDIYIAQMGKIYAWDDVTKVDEIEYDDEKLNELEKSRRENVDKIKLVNEQYANEYKKVNIVNDRKEKQLKRMQKKLYEKGLITKKELDMIQENVLNKKNNNNIDYINEIRNDVEECWKVDYLDENDDISLKYGCISIYSPKYIGGLTTFCFKIRGLFQTEKGLEDRMRELKELYPDDRIYRFDVGKWCAYSDEDINEIDKLKYLNYSMKIYLDSLVKEKEEFDKRKEDLQKTAENQSKLTKINNLKNKKQKRKENKIQSFNDEDNKYIQNIIDFLYDPELHNKFKNSNPNDKIEIKVN